MTPPGDTATPPESKLDSRQQCITLNDIFVGVALSSPDPDSQLSNDSAIFYPVLITLDPGWSVFFSGLDLIRVLLRHTILIKIH